MTTERNWSMSTRLLLTAAEGLARRGETVTACYPRASATATGAESGFPSVALRSMDDDGFFAQWRTLRRVVSATRPSALLVHGERDTLIAAFAIGRKGGVVRRARFGESVRKTWRTRTAAARTKVVLLDGHGREPRKHADASLSSLSWPTPAERAVRANHVVGAVGAVAAPHPRLVIFPSRDASANTPVALRTAAHLLTRNASLRVTLVGDDTTLQGSRIHAASLGLTDQLDLISVDDFLHSETLDATAVWVTAEGDEGAIALLSAMTRSLPGVVPGASSIESMVVRRITGFVADGDDPTATVAALARLVSDASEQRAMGDAAGARASRVHSWSSWLDRVTESLHAASGLRAAPRAAVAPTPA